MKSHPLEKITNYEIAELFNKAYGRVAAIEKAIKGFSSAGIYPLNPAIFNDDFGNDQTIDNTANIVQDSVQDQQPSTSRMGTSSHSIIRVTKDHTINEKILLAKILLLVDFKPLKHRYKIYHLSQQLLQPFLK